MPSAQASWPSQPIARRPLPSHAPRVTARGIHGAAPRSAEAERFDPPCLRVAFRSPVRLSAAALRDALLQALGGDGELLERMLRHRGLQVGGRVVGDTDLPGIVEAETAVLGWALLREPEAIALRDEDLLLDAEGVVAVSKPAWLPVQGTRASQRFSLEAALQQRLRAPQLRAVHRLDRETSGLVLFARDASAARFLGRQMALRAIRRRYLALVSPAPEQTAFEVAGHLVRRLDPQRFRFALAPAPEPGSRWSRTRFAVVRRGSAAALLEAEPETGRTHQIRVHLAHGGTPVVGDRLYGGTPAADRTLLHAARIGFRLPSGAEAALEAPAPPDLDQAFPGAG